MNSNQLHGVEDETSHLVLLRSQKPKTYLTARGQEVMPLAKVNSKKDKVKRMLPTDEEHLQKYKRITITEATMRTASNQISTATNSAIIPGNENSSENHNPPTNSISTKESHIVAAVPTHNYYDPLNQTVDEEMQTNESSTINEDYSQSNDKQNTKRFPPIIVPTLPSHNNYFEYHRQLEKELGHTLKIIYHQKQGTKYHVTSQEAFDKLQNIFREKRIGYFTFTPKFQKPLQIVIKRLPTHVTAQQLQEELQVLDFPVINVRQLTITKQENGTFIKCPIPVWVVSLTNNDYGRSIYDLKAIQYQPVLIESYNPESKIYQCFNCQQYGHTSAGCHLPSKCVKCSQNHRIAECPIKGHSVEPKCANCGQPHTANFRQCEVAIQQKNALQQRKMNKQQRLQNREAHFKFYEKDFPRLPSVQPPPAWSSNAPNNQATPKIEIMEDIKELYTFIQGLGLNRIVAQLKLVTQKLKQAPDTFSKMFILFEAVTEILTPVHAAP